MILNLEIVSMYCLDYNLEEDSVILVLIMKKLSYLIIFLCMSSAYSSEYEFGGYQCIDKHLDNRDCSNGVTYRKWNEAYDRWKDHLKPKTFEQYDKEKFQFIVLHYTAGTSLKSAIDTYNERGVSAHFAINTDGIRYITVDPKKYISFHAGSSYFAGKTSLNFWSIGIEHVNPGVREEYKKYDGFLEPIQLNGSKCYWYPFSEEQFQSSVTLTRELQESYKIPGWNVVTHADIAPSRKIDIGPMWDYKRSFEEFGVGYYPSEGHNINLTSFDSIEDNDYIKFLTFLGYENCSRVSDLIRTYKFHYSTSDVSRVNILGVLTSDTKEDILNHIISLYDYIDPITGTKYDYFMGKFKEWAFENQDKSSAFSEFISLN